MIIDTFVAIGGTQDCRSGNEIFMQRLASVWPDTGLGALTVLPANTALLKAPDRLLGCLGHWLASLARITHLVYRHGFRRNARVTVWYHCSNALDLISILWISFLPGVRLLVTPHCSFTWRHLFGPIRKWLVLKVLRRSAGLLVLSEEQRRFFDKSGAPVRRIRTLIPQRTGTFVPFDRRPAGSLAFVGRVARETGVPQMLELMRRLCGVSPHFRLDIFGEVEREMAVLLQEAMQGDPILRRAIRIIGPVSPTRIAAELGNYRYLLHLSTVDAFPLAVLEAITAGTVPVVFALPGTDEIIAQWGGVSADADDIGNLGARLLDLELARSSPTLRSVEAIRYYGPSEVARDIRQSLGVPC